MNHKIFSLLPGTLIVPIFIIKCHIYPRHDRIPGVSELHLHQLPGSNAGPVLLQPGHHSPGGLWLDGVEHLGLYSK